MEQCQKVDAVGHVAVVHEVPPTWCCKDRQANLVGVILCMMICLDMFFLIFEYVCSLPLVIPMHNHVSFCEGLILFKI